MVPERKVEPKITSSRKHRVSMTTLPSCKACEAPAGNPRHPAHQPWEKPLASIVLCLTDAVVPKLTSMLNHYKHLALLFTYPREMISRVVACIVL